MCTVILLRRPGHAWPLLLAGNRDEMLSRPWDPPGRHWEDRPEVVAGRDRLVDGSWLGLNDSGVVACVLNRQGTLGPEAGKRSRGELVLEALDHADAADAAQALAELRPESYRPFNLIVADNRDAAWLRNDGTRITSHALPQGLSMITSADRNEMSHPRVARHLADLVAAPAPDPAAGIAGWASWTEILARRPDKVRADGMTIPPSEPGGFGTASSGLIALPAEVGPEHPPRFLFAPGAPGDVPWEPVRLA